MPANLTTTIGTYGSDAHGLICGYLFETGEAGVAIVAGLLGMNVGSIPLGQSEHGFWAVLAIVAAFTAGVAWFAVRRLGPRRRGGGRVHRARRHDTVICRRDHRVVAIVR